MCRALKVLCAAIGQEGLAALKRSALSASWELTGGAADAGELLRQVRELRPDVVVLEAAFGPDVVEAIRAAHSTCRVVSLGAVPGADAQAGSAEEIRAAILGLPPPGGPVRR